jgi:hypothetical protein
MATNRRRTIGGEPGAAAGAEVGSAAPANPSRTGAALDELRAWLEEIEIAPDHITECPPEVAAALERLAEGERRRK